MSRILDLSSFNLLASAAAHCGADLNAVLEQLDFQFAADGDAMRKLSLTEVSALLTTLEAHASKRYLPFAFAEIFNFDGQPEISAFLVSAEKLRDLGPLLDWIPGLLHPSIRFEGLDEGHWAHTIIHVDDALGAHTDMPAFIELIAAVVVRLNRTTFASTGNFHEIRFGHSPRVAQHRYEEFFECSVSFHHPDTRLIQESSLLDRSLPGSLPAAHAQAEQSIRLKLIGDGMAPPLSLQIRDWMREEPALLSEGLDPLARRLKMTPRTLQRQLRAEGRSYSQILARTRHQMACEMLREGALDIDSIAFKLGFSERRSFTQAFRKWQGQTPSVYRKASKR